METTGILLNRVIIMFLLAGVGYIAYKKGKISDEGSKSIGNILIFISLPSVIISGFITERTPDKIRNLAISALLAAVILFISIIVSALVFRKDAIASFAGAFSNPGFFGIPIIAALISSGASFYVASFIAFLNLLQWSYGVSILTGQKTGLKIKKIVTAPFMIAIFIGLIIFFSGITPPEIITSTLSFCAGLNTPLAMFAVGVYLAQCNFSRMIRRKELYIISAVRLILVPLICLLMLWGLSSVNTDLRYSLLICAACPVGSNIAVYAQLHNKDYTYAVETVTASTLLCIITLPLVVRLAGMLWI